MAAVNIQNTSMKLNEAAVLPTSAAIDAAGGAAVSYRDREDARILLIIENGASSEKTARIEAGDGIQGISDLVMELAANEKRIVTVESGKYMKTCGENRGAVIIKGTDANIKVAAIELP